MILIFAKKIKRAKSKKNFDIEILGLERNTRCNNLLHNGIGGRRCFAKVG